MLSVLIQNLRYSIRSLLKSPGFSTAATLTVALGIGVLSVSLSLFVATIGPMSYSRPIQEVLTSNVPNNSERATRSLRSSPPIRTTRGSRRFLGQQHRSAGIAALRTSPERRPNRRRLSRSVICSAARMTHSRGLRQQNRIARCIQTGASDLEHAPTAPTANATNKTGEKSCTV